MYVYTTIVSSCGNSACVYKEKQPSLHNTHTHITIIHHSAFLSFFPMIDLCELTFFTLPILPSLKYHIAFSLLPYL